MADVTINGLGGPLASPAADDLVAVWDTSAGQTLKVRRDVLVGAIITGGGTLALGGNTLTVNSSGGLTLGGFTLTVPATGTAGLLGTAQTYTAAPTFSAGVNASGITPTGVSMVNGNIQALSNWTSLNNGILLILDTSGTQYAIFSIKGGANSTQEILDPNNTFSAAADTANSINIYYSSGYKIQNNRAYTTVLRVLGIGA